MSREITYDMYKSGSIMDRKKAEHGCTTIGRGRVHKESEKGVTVSGTGYLGFKFIPTEAILSSRS